MIRIKLSQIGFTLIEILIALFIFAILSVITSSILFSVLNARTATKSRVQQLNAIQLTTILLQRDISQLINRPIRASNSNIIPAIIAQSNYLEFTHSGNSNPFETFQQSHLQRVAYEIKNGNFIRKTWPSLDRVSSNIPSTRILLTHVIAGKFLYLGPASVFYNYWPPATLLNIPNLNGEPIPRAIAIQLNLAHWGRYYFIVAISST